MKKEIVSITVNRKQVEAIVVSEMIPKKDKEGNIVKDGDDVITQCNVAEIELLIRPVSHRIDVIQLNKESIKVLYEKVIELENQEGVQETITK